MDLRRLFPLCLALLAGGCAIFGGGGGDYLVRGEIGSVVLSPDGEFGLEDASGVTLRNTVEQLGLDDRESEAYAKVALRLGSNELSLSGFQTEFSGSGTLSADFGSITATTAVNSSLDFTNLKFLYRWYLVDLDVFSLGPGLGVDYIDFDAQVVAPSLGNLTEDFDAKAPIPVPGLSSELRLGPLRAFADLYGISVNSGDADGTFMDLEGGLRFSPLPNVDAVVGYRLIRFEASGTDGSEDFDVDYKLPGLFFSVGIRF